MIGTHERLVALLRENDVAYRIIEHQAEGRSEHISKIRGNHPKQAMKAIVVTLKGGGKGTRHALAVLPGNRRLDMRALRKAFGAQKGSFTPAEEATQLTGCAMGSVPPFTFWEELPLIADNAIRENREVVFNAGRLDRSIFMPLEDYIAVAKPTLADIAQPASTG